MGMVPQPFCVRFGKVTLTKAGANVNVTDNEGDSAIVSAIRKGHFHCLEELVRGGAVVHLDNLNNRKNGSVGANVDVTDNEGDSAIMNAIRKGHFNCSDELAREGAAFK
eukprot:Pgem_evm2s297